MPHARPGFYGTKLNAVHETDLTSTRWTVVSCQGLPGAGKPIAAVCHAPWAFIDADLAEGKTLTSDGSTMYP